MFTVVIPTHNRSRLVGRAIESALRQQWVDLEIIVVDDASTDDTESVIQSLYPQVRYLKQTHNQGPGLARQRGIQEATHPWVILLDDDDQLLDHALTIISKEIIKSPDLVRYPVLMFAHGNGYLAEPFKILSLDDYFSGSIKGDMLSVINRSKFLDMGMSYPAIRLGGEHLLWWKIADDCGIPAWNNQVTVVGSDATNRLTSFRQQIRHAEDHACLQEMTLHTFENRLENRFPQFIEKKHLGAAVYWLLAGKPRSASAHLNYLATHGKKSIVFGIRLLSIIPSFILRQLFGTYRMLEQVKFRCFSGNK